MLWSLLYKDFKSFLSIRNIKKTDEVYADDEENFVLVKEKKDDNAMIENKVLYKQRSLLDIYPVVFF